MCFDDVSDKIEDIDDFADNDIAVWNENVFSDYLKFTYTLTNIIEYNGEFKILLLQCSNDNTDKWIGFKKGQDCYLSSNLNSGMFFGRNCLYPIDRYKNIIIKNHWVTGFENIPQYVNSCIFNPFGKYVKFDSFIEDIKNFDKDNVRLYVEKNIKKIVTKSLVEDVIHHSILEGDEKPDEDKVYADYIKLVVDMILASKKYEKKSVLKNTRSLKNDNNEDNDMPNSTGEDTMKSDTEMNNVTKVGDDITNIVDDVMVNDGEDGTKVSDIESNNCGE